MVPTFDEKIPIEKWASILLKKAQKSKLEDLLREYYKVIKNCIKEDIASYDFIMEIIKDKWLIYLYPNIYMKYYNKKIKTEDIGYHPYCPRLFSVN